MHNTQRQLADIDATRRAAHVDAVRQTRLKNACDELVRNDIELEVLQAAAQVPGMPLHLHSSAGRAAKPHGKRIAWLNERQGELQAQIAWLERQEAESTARWHAAQDRQAAADRDAELRAEFDRQERQGREQRFAEFKQQQQGRSAK